MNDAVRAAVDVLRGAGLTCEDVSIPWHLHGARIWDVIATEGATFQMVDANGYGMNWKGLYDPEVIAHYGDQWRGDGSQFSETVKLVLLAGRHTIDTHHGQHYAMARNLAFELTRGLRRGAGPLRRAGHADHADPGLGHPGPRRRRARR